MEEVNGNFIYLVSHDGHRDSVNLEKCAKDDDGLKQIIIEECLEIGQIIMEETMTINHTRSGGWAYYQYKEQYGDDGLDDGKHGFFKLKII